MKNILKIWPIALFAIGLFFLPNKNQIQPKALSAYDFELFIPTESRKILNQQLKDFPSIKKEYVDAEIVINEKAYAVEIKFHGTDWNHFFNGAQSFKIKIKEDISKTLKAGKYQLVKKTEMNIGTAIANSLAREEGLLAPVGKMVDVYIEGKVEAYYLVEHHNQAFLDRNGFEQGVLLSQVSDWSRKEQWQRNLQHASPYDWEKEHIEHENHDYFSEALTQFEKLGICVKENHKDSLAKYIDFEYVARFFSIAQLFNEVHFLTGDNLKWAYKPSNKKLYPYFRMESEGKRLPKEQEMNFADFDKHIFNHSIERYGKSENLDFFRVLLTNEGFRTIRNKELYRLAQMDFEKYSDSVYYKCRSNSDRDRTNDLTIQSHQKEIFKINAQLARKHLEYAHIYGTYKKSTKELSVITDAFSNIYLKINGCVTPHCNSLKYDDKLNIIHQKTIFNHIEQEELPELEFYNDVTGEKCDKVFFNIID